MSDALWPSRSMVSSSERPCSAISCSRSRSHISYATCGRCATSLLGRRASMKLSTSTVTLAASTGSSETCSLIIHARFLPCHCRLVPSKYTLEIPLELLFIQSRKGYSRKLNFRFTEFSALKCATGAFSQVLHSPGPRPTNVSRLRSAAFEYYRACVRGGCQKFHKWLLCGKQLSSLPLQ